MVSEKIRVLGELTKRLKTRPVLVGGGAVEFYTAGTYTTGDMDIIGRSEEIVPALTKMGFKKEGMYFIKGKLFIHIVGSYFSERYDDIAFQGSDLVIRIISIEDLIVDRLNACKWWSSATDCEQARSLLGTYLAKVDMEYLKGRAEEEKVLDFLDEMLGKDRPSKKRVTKKPKRKTKLSRR